MKTIRHFLGIVFLSVPLFVPAQIDQYVIGNLGGEIQTASGDISFIQSIGDIAGAFINGSTAKFSQGFPQCFNCDICLTVGEVYLDAEIYLRIFPNPTSDGIILDGATEGIRRYQIYNVQGVLMIDGAFPGNEIDLGFLPPGLFVIRFLDKNGRGLATGKVFKQ